MRAFIAIALPEDTRAALCDFGERLRTGDVHASWVKPDAMHLTMRFLGDISEEQSDALCSFLREAVRDLTAPVLLTRGVGAFPSIRKPSVIWAGVEVIQRDLDSIHRVAESGARAIGLPPDDKTFHPHITLGRLRKRDDVHACVATLTPYLAEGMAPEFGNEFKAANMVLFSSTLTRHGPIHRKIEEFLLQ